MGRKKRAARAKSYSGARGRRVRRWAQATHAMQKTASTTKMRHPRKRAKVPKKHPVTSAAIRSARRDCVSLPAWARTEPTPPIRAAITKGVQICSIKLVLTRRPEIANAGGRRQAPVSL
jgi:hypothetical protein